MLFLSHILLFFKVCYINKEQKDYNFLLLKRFIIFTVKDKKIG